MKIKDWDAFLMLIVVLLVVSGIFIFALHIWHGFVAMGLGVLIACLRFLWLLAGMAFERKARAK